MISEDVFPEIATELGRLTNPLRRSRCSARSSASTCGERTTVVAIGERMRERLIAKGAAPERVIVIPNWVDTAAITPRPTQNDWSRDAGLDGRFVVMHSGNVGHAQNLDNLVRRDDAPSRPRRPRRSRSSASAPAAASWSSSPTQLEADRVRFLRTSRASASASRSPQRDIHYVGLATGLSGFVVPSRLYGILSAGRPVIVAADADSETARLVSEVGCGVVVPPTGPTSSPRRSATHTTAASTSRRWAPRVASTSSRDADRLLALGRYREVVRGLLAATRS